MQSNCIAENYGIFTNIDKTVFVPYKVQKGKEYPVLIDNKLFVFINSNKTYPVFVQELQKYTKKEIIQKEINMLDVLNGVLKKEYDGVMFHDVMTTDDFFIELYVDYDEVEKYKNVIEIVEYLYKQINGKATHRVTLMNLMDRYFTYFGNLNDFNNYIIKNDKATDNENVPLLRIFSSPALANEYKKNENISAQNNVTTLRNIIKELQKDVGVIIDMNRSYGTSISRELLDESVYQTEDSYNRDVIKDKMQYYKHLDEFYIVINPCGDFDNGVSCVLTTDVVYNKKEVPSILVFETYNDAKKFVDSVIIDNIANIHAIGVVDSKEFFETILNRVYTLGTKHITFEYGTNRQLVMKIKDAYEEMYDSKFTFKPNENLVTIKFKDKMPPKGLTEENKKHLSSLSKNQLNKMICNGNCEELLHILSEKSKQINKILNENNKQPTEEVRVLNREFENILKIFILRLMMKRRLSIVIDKKTRKPLLSSTGLPYLQIEEKYITSFAEIADFDFCEKTINNLKKISNLVIFTNNDNAGCVVGIDSIERTYKRIHRDEQDRAKIILYLTYKCDLTLDEALSVYCLMLFNLDLLNEFKQFVSNGAEKFFETETSYKCNGETASQIFKRKRFSHKYMAYLEIVEQLCKEKENSDGSN